MNATSRTYDFGKNGTGQVIEAVAGTDDGDVFSVWIPDNASVDMEVSMLGASLRVERRGLLAMRDAINAALRETSEGPRWDGHGPLCKCTPCVTDRLDAKDDQ